MREPIHWRLDVRGLGLRVWELTDPDAVGPPIVCLHGWLDQGMAFSELARGRAGRWLAPDQRGFGGSDHPGPGAGPHFPDLVADLDALVRRLGVPIDLVGHSMGATVALMYAGARPDRVRRLVTVDGMGTHAQPPSAMVLLTRAFLDGLAHPPKQVRLPSVEAAARRLQRRHPAISADLAWLLAVHGTEPADDGEGVAWRFDPLHMVSSPHPFMEEAFAGFLAEIRAPTLVIWAGESIYPEGERDLRAGRIAGARSLVHPGSHMLLYDDPRGLGDLIERFLVSDADGAARIGSPISG